VNKEKFFEEVKSSLFGGKLTQTQVDGLEAIIDEWNAQGGGHRSQLAYVLATPYHEVGRSYKPVRENLNYTTAAKIRQVWPSRFKTDSSAQPFVKQPKKLAIEVYGGRLGNKTKPSEDGWIYRGGGWPQTTGRTNYAKFGLEENPNDILQPKVSAHALVKGMKDGLYTGKKLSDFINEKQVDYVSARALINADKTRKTNTGTIGSDIAGYAMKFDLALKNAGYGQTTTPKPVPEVILPPILQSNIPATPIETPKPKKSNPSWVFPAIVFGVLVLAAIIFI